MKNLLTIGQLLLVMAMLIGAALFARSAMNAVAANPGFEFGSNFYVWIDERSTGDTEQQALELIRNALGESATAGVSAAALGVAL